MAALLGRRTTFLTPIAKIDLFLAMSTAKSESKAMAHPKTAKYIAEYMHVPQSARSAYRALGAAESESIDPSFMLINRLAVFATDGS